MHTAEKVLLAAALLTLPSLTISQSAWASTAIPDTHGAVKDQLPQSEARVESSLPAEPAEQSGKSFTLQKLTVDPGDMKLNAASLEKIGQNYVGKSITMKELNQAVMAVTNYCRTHGYPAAAAYLPSQSTGNGELVIKLLPGRYGKIQLDNQSGIADSLVQSYIHGLHTGDVIVAKELETALYTLSELSGVRAAGLLSPGSEVGTSDVTVKMTKGKKNVAILYAENYGSNSSGRYRYGLQDIVNNLTGRGDKLSLSGLISNHDLRNYAVNYEAPLGIGGSTAGIGYSRMDYELGGALSNIGATGKADTYSLYGKTPLFVTTNRSLYVNYGYNYRKLKDDLQFFSVTTEKHTHSFFAGINGHVRSGKSLVQYDLTGYHGTLCLDSDYARIQNQLSDIEGAYTKGILNVKYQQGIDSRWELLVKGQVQLASRNLDSSEDIYLGGANGVRAYPQGEASGDQGYVASTELRYRTGTPGLVLSTYLDGGHVALSRDGSTGGETLKGYGFAISYTKPDNWFARFDYARRIGGDDKMSSEAQSRSRMWFLLGKIF